MRGIGRELSRLPLVLRCIVLGASCVGTIAAVFGFINGLLDYPAADIAQASLFGLFEGFVLGGVSGCCLGVAVGLVAYLIRSGMRGVTHRRG